MKNCLIREKITVKMLNCERNLFSLSITWRGIILNTIILMCNNHGPFVISPIFWSSFKICLGVGDSRDRILFYKMWKPSMFGCSGIGGAASFLTFNSSKIKITNFTRNRSVQNLAYTNVWKKPNLIIFTRQSYQLQKKQAWKVWLELRKKEHIYSMQLLFIPSAVTYNPRTEN